MMKSKAPGNGVSVTMPDWYKNYGPWAIIAGGSEGIGLCFAQQLAAAGIHLVLLARRQQALNDARATLTTDYDVEVRIQSIDLTAGDLEQKLDAIVEDLEIGLMIYNAGAMHGAELFVDSSLKKAQQLINLNCHGPAVFCHKLGKPMRDRARGGIILLSSVSGLAGGAYVATYAATKSFDIVFAEALWAEMKPFGVDVLCLVAGATDTPAMARSGIDFDSGSDFPPMRPEDVAAEGLQQLANGPVHVAGDGNRAVADILRADRVQAIDLLSRGAAGMFNKPFPIAGEE
jgi:short-subunit dehydrogenase